MPNTGNVITITLKEVSSPGGIPTGATKNNLPADPDYIDVYYDTVACPLTFTDTCPTVIATGEPNSLLFEFSLPNAVVNNPSIVTINVKAMIGAAQQAIVVFNLPNVTPNYFKGELTGLASTTAYTIDIEYLNSSAVVVKTCTAVASVSTNSTNNS